MNFFEICEILEADVLAGKEYLDREVSAGCASDLMSDVLAYGQTNSILLTGLATAQVIYTVEMAGNQAVCFVRGKKPPKEAIALAKKKKFVLLATPLPMFEACGRLFEKGLKRSFVPLNGNSGKPRNRAPRRK